MHRSNRPRYGRRDWPPRGAMSHSVLFRSAFRCKIAFPAISDRSSVCLIDPVIGMREAVFIRRNEARWKKLEQVLHGMDRLSADEASELYIQLNDDLSYARTFYPRGSVPEYLNGLATRLHHHIYRNQRTARSRFIS